MKTSKLKRNGFKTALLAGLVVIGSGTLLSQGLIHAAPAAEAIKKTTPITTNNVDHTTDLSKASQNSLPEGYKKANYTVETIDLEYFHNQKPTSKDMAKADAAEIGAQALWEIFNLSLEGQVIEMGFQPATESLSRSSWYADVLINGERSYYFEVDSETGELFGIGRSRTLDKKVSLGFDSELHKNPQEYVELAKKLAAKYNVVHSPIKAVEYSNQGYSNNDPSITMDITGENGEIAIMTFSRYDKALLGIGYHTPTKYALEYNEKLDKKLQEKVKELEKSAPVDNKNEAPSLRAIDLD